MAVKSRADLKKYFERGDKPTQREFEDLIESFYNIKDDERNLAALVGDASSSKKGVVQRATSSELDAAIVADKFVSPVDVKRMIGNLAVTSVNDKTGQVTLPAGVQEMSIDQILDKLEASPNAINRLRDLLNINFKNLPFTESIVCNHGVYQYDHYAMSKDLNFTLSGAQREDYQGWFTIRANGVNSISFSDDFDSEMAAKVPEGTDLVKDEEYRLYMIWNRASGKMDVVWQGAVAVTEAVVTQLVKPLITAAQVVQNGVAIDWEDNSEGNYQVEILRSNSASGTFSQIATVSSSMRNYVDNASLVSGSTYFYKIRLVDTSSSVDSDVTSVNYVTTQPDSIVAPSNLTATVNGTSVTLNWTNESTGNFSYKIFRKWSSVNGYQAEKATLDSSATSYHDPVLLENRSYDYKVVVTNGIESREASVSATTQNNTVILLQDDFSAALNNNNIRNVVNPSNVLSIENNQLKIRLSGAANSIARGVNYIEYPISVNDDVVVSQVSIISSNTASSGVAFFHSLYLNNTDRVQIQVATNRLSYRLIVKSTSNNSYDYTTNVQIGTYGTTRIIHYRTTNLVEFQYWNNTQWVRMGGRKDVDASMINAIARIEGSNGVSAGQTVQGFMDNFYYSNQVYATQNPV